MATDVATGQRGQTADSAFIAVGRIVGPHGIKGELKVELATDDPRRFFLLETVYLGEEHIAHYVERVRLHKGRALLLLEEIDTPDLAETWRDAYVYIRMEDALPLAENQYYIDDIIGLKVLDEEGNVLGRVVEVLPTGSNDVYVISGLRGELLLPALSDVVLEIDLDRGQMIVRIPEGLA